MCKKALFYWASALAAVSKTLKLDEHVSLAMLVSIRPGYVASVSTEDIAAFGS